MEGLLLAAGAGSRMGAPKALVSDDRGSWLQRGVANLREGGCRRVTVVLGAEAERAAALLEELAEKPRVVVAEEWAEGMGASLRAGLRALADSTDDFMMLTLVDLPDLVPEVVARVAEAQRSPHVLARAAYEAAGVPTGKRSPCVRTAGWGTRWAPRSWWRASRPRAPRPNNGAT